MGRRGANSVQRWACREGEGVWAGACRGRGQTEQGWEVWGGERAAPRVERVLATHRVVGKERRRRGR